MVTRTASTYKKSDRYEKVIQGADVPITDYDINEQNEINKERARLNTLNIGGNGAVTSNSLTVSSGSPSYLSPDVTVILNGGKYYIDGYLLDLSASATMNLINQPSFGTLYPTVPTSGTETWKVYLGVISIEVSDTTKSMRVKRSTADEIITVLPSGRTKLVYAFKVTNTGAAPTGTTGEINDGTFVHTGVSADDITWEAICSFPVIYSSGVVTVGSPTDERDLFWCRTTEQGGSEVVSNPLPFFMKSVLTKGFYNPNGAEMQAPTGLVITRQGSSGGQEFILDISAPISSSEFMYVDNQFIKHSSDIIPASIDLSSTPSELQTYLTVGGGAPTDFPKDSGGRLYYVCVNGLTGELEAYVASEGGQQSF